MNISTTANYLLLRSNCTWECVIRSKLSMYKLQSRGSMTILFLRFNCSWECVNYKAELLLL